LINQSSVIGQNDLPCHLNDTFLGLMALLEDSFFWIDSPQFSDFQAIPISNDR
jgi:hypothetical protein